MSHKSNARVYLSLVLFVSISLSIILLWCLRTSQASMPETPAPGYTVELVPDQMTVAGDVTTLTNCVQITVCSWFEGTPTGTIMLGVDPTSPYTVTWDGGSATGEIYLPDVYSPTLVVLKISWPHWDGKGLHSPEQNRMGTVTLDGRPLWGKRTTHQSTFGDYYAAQYQPILTTIVVTRSITHTLTFSVPARTAWDLSRIEFTAYPYSTTIKGIGYSPFRDCQYPGGTSQPSIQDLREDLFRLFHTCNAIRTYAAGGVNGQIPALANEIGLPIFAGVWINGVQKEDDAEVQAVIDLACTNDLEGIIVGNEFFLRSQRTSEDIAYLLLRIRQVTQGVLDRCGKDVPVTTAEIDNLMFGWESDTSAAITGIQSVYRPILDEVDFVMVHTYPFWNRMPIDGAAAFTVKRYQAIQALLEQVYPGQNKWVIIGETGWPSSGTPNGSAVPSMDNQHRYLLEFLDLAEQEDVNFMYFDAFDELWKIEEPGRVGQHWGYSYTDRSAKYNFYGVLLPPEQVYFARIYLPYVARQSASSLSLIPVDWEVADVSPQSPIQASSSISFPMYTEWPMEPGSFVPSGWMGDLGNISMYECERTNPHSGEMAIRVSFAPTGTLGWSGVYWQHPENNWGTLEGGYSFTGASRLTFWVRGDQGGEGVEFFVGGLGDPTDPYSDTIRPARSSGPIVLSDQWEQVEIRLAGADLGRVIGGFAWVAGHCHNSEPIIFYLDDIAVDFAVSPAPLAAPARRPFHVYDDDDPECNHFVPSGWMGDVGDISLDPSWAGDPYSGTTAISVTYSALGSHGKNGAGVYWQEPEDNWGDVDGGFDLSWANKLTFWAKGERGGERVRFFVGGIGTKNNAYPDSLRPAVSTGFLQLGDAWREYTINLRGQNLTRVIGGFGWATDQCANPQGATFHLDDVAFQFDPDVPEPPPPGPTFPIYTDAAAVDNHYFPTAWMGDGEVPGRVSLTECWYTNPHSGQTAIRVAYTDEVVGWAGIYWVDPPENWGDRPGGADLRGADRLTFWARSDTPNAHVKFLIGGIGYPNGTACWNPSEPYPCSACPKIEVQKTLTGTWTKYTIDLHQYPRDLSRVVGGFGWVAETEVTFYLDDIVYEFD